MTSYPYRCWSAISRRKPARVVQWHAQASRVEYASLLRHVSTSNKYGAVSTERQAEIIATLGNSSDRSSRMDNKCKTSTRFCVTRSGGSSGAIYGVLLLTLLIRPQHGLSKVELPRTVLPRNPFPIRFPSLCAPRCPADLYNNGRTPRRYSN
jgi:hypothetical protein